ncbi:hypothetical protein AB1Y20_015865 [Prymnesium parvum]|uniref:Uncharacterized protein n=1 Tax=Prymnesium parvum TaxID=97485 RepID=A0AB34K286_PRYPA
MRAESPPKLQLRASGPLPSVALAILHNPAFVLQSTPHTAACALQCSLLYIKGVHGPASSGAKGQSQGDCVVAISRGGVYDRVPLLH